MRRKVLSVLVVVFLACAQVPLSPPSGGGGGGGGGGTVTSIATACGLSGGPITATGTVQESLLVDSQTGAGAFAIPSADCGKLILRNQAAAVSDTIAQAGSGGNFPNGWLVYYQCQGAGGCTITPTTSTIDGGSSIVLVQGQGILIQSDGSNYHLFKGLNGTLTSLSTSCGLGGGTITSTGTVQLSYLLDSQNGAGAFAIPNSDCGKLISRNNAAALSDTIAQAGAGGNFPNGWLVSYQCVGAGGCTITPAVSTIDGASSAVLTQGQGLTIESDGSNYHTLRGGSGGAGALAVQANGTLIGTRSTMNFLTGTGTVITVTDTGTKINVQIGVDTGVVLTIAAFQTGQALYCAPASASGTTYTCALSTTLTTYTTGMTLNFTPDVNGSGGATTLNVDTVGAKAIKQADGTTNPTSSSLVAGQQYTLWYDGTLFRIKSGGGGSAVTTRTWSYTFQGTVQSAATGYGLNLPSSSAPTLTNAGGTVPVGILQWPTAQSTYYAWLSFIIPTGYVTNSALSYTVESTCDSITICDSTHASIMTLSLACQGTSSTLNNPTFGAASTVNITNTVGGDQTITTGTLTPNSGALPACSAGQRAWIKMVFDTNTNALTGAFDLASFTVNLTAGL